MTRRHTATHALGALTGRWFSDEDRAQLRLVGYWLIVCAGTCVLGLALSALGPALDAFDTWRADMRAQHQAAQAAAHQLQSQRRYIAWVQAECGAEAWWKPRADGALVCTDKHGRSTRRVLVGAQP
jgi:hypothetical protein